MKEIWKDIKDFEDYQVSNFGNVKSLKYNKERILKAGIISSGYFVVSLSKNNEIKNYIVHQLVAINFLNHEPCRFKLVVNHKDFNRLNNHVDNLEIVTTRENTNVKHLPSSSKYLGVTWFKQTNKWRSQIHLNGKKFHLGYFKNEYDAHICYLNKLKELKL